MANKSTLIGRRNYGMKIAMPGFDAMTAGDNQLLFNSSFPILQIKILSELYALGATSPNGNLGGEYIGTANGDRVYRWYHGLGYPPFFLTLNQGGVIFNSDYMVDDQYIYRKGNPWTGAPLQDGTRVLLCPIDLTLDIEYPYTAKPLERPIFNSIEYGFKSIEYGDIIDHNFDNLGIDIRLQSQMLLANKTMKTSSIPSSPGEWDIIEVDYTLPKGMTINDVVAYGFAQQKIDPSDSNSPRAYISVGQYAQSAPTVSVGYPTDDNIRLSTFYSQPGSLVVVRQPLVSSDRKLETI